jgi:hypothetical protein
MIPGSRDLVGGALSPSSPQPRKREEARTPRGSGFRLFRQTPSLPGFYSCHSTPPRLPYTRLEPLIFSDILSIRPATLPRRITNLTGFSLGVATVAQHCASALQKICKCLVDTFGDICSRALRARMTGRALFKACLSNCMQPPMSLWLRPWTDLTRSWRKPCLLQ